MHTTTTNWKWLLVARRQTGALSSYHTSNTTMHMVPIINRHHPGTFEVRYRAAVHLQPPFSILELILRFRKKKKDASPETHIWYPYSLQPRMKATLADQLRTVYQTCVQYVHVAAQPITAVTPENHKSVFSWKSQTCAMCLEHKIQPWILQRRYPLPICKNSSGNSFHVEWKQSDNYGVCNARYDAVSCLWVSWMPKTFHLYHKKGRVSYPRLWS